MPFSKLTGAILFAVASQAANASGFALIEQSASGQGLSYAGAAANAEDASVMWFNPAGLTEIEGSQAILGAHVISPSAKFTDSATGATEDGTTDGLVPNLYWKGDFKGYAVGLSVTVPFGQKIVYDDNWSGRYHALETDLKTVNLNANIARKLNDKVSVGFGLNAQHVDLKMSQAKFNGTNDSTISIDADSWGYGYNFGLMADLALATKLGFSYRSEVTHNAKGSADYDGLAPTAGASADVTLPATAMLSLSHKVDDKIQILADATWTGWRAYDELVVEFDNGSADSLSGQEFKDSMRYSLGMIYNLDDKWKLRTGVALDNTPIQDAEHRTPRTPDSDRTWISAGFNYKLTKSMSVDAAYSHLFADKADVNLIGLAGSYDSAVDILSAQLVWKY